MSKITLDAETFKALASATRLTVLKALDERRKTLTELSTELQLNKATVHEHLGLLLAAGLIRKRDDEGRKWIYYELTWTGQGILRPEATTTFNVLLGLSVLAAGGGFFMLGRALDWWLSSSGAGIDPTDNAEGSRLADESAPDAQALSASSDTGTSSPDSGTAAASSTDTGTSSAGASTGSSTQGSGAPEYSADKDAGSDQFLVVDDGAAADGAGPGQPFFDDGGWLAVALISAFVVFCALAAFLHWRLKPKAFDPAAAEAAEAASNETEPAPSG